MLHRHRAGGIPAGTGSLTEGPILPALLSFAVPLFFGQLLQQLYNLGDAWVVGNFADNDAFAAVSSSGNVIFLIIGFCNGIAVGGGVVISRYFGAREDEKLSRSIHTCILFGLLCSAAGTLLGLLFVPQMLLWMNTPESVLPHALSYYRIYFGGVVTVVMYNICMAIMRALGDSLRPLYYLLLSSCLNVGLDLLLVAGLHWGVTGAATATVFSQGVSLILCLLRMSRLPGAARISWKKLRFDRDMMAAVIRQGLPSGIQNSVISVGNIVVQSNINAFGAFAMAGQGASAKVEGFAFLPITAMSLALPTFISQNLGAGQVERAKKGARLGIGIGVVLAEIIGVIFFFLAPTAIGWFVSQPESIAFGTIHSRTVTLFYCLLAFSHCAAGVLRGCGKSVVPMAAMLTFWCGFRIVYVTAALKLVHEFFVICWAYPITWTCTTLVFSAFLLRLSKRSGQAELQKL